MGKIGAVDEVHGILHEGASWRGMLLVAWLVFVDESAVVELAVRSFHSIAAASKYLVLLFATKSLAFIEQCSQTLTLGNCSSITRRRVLCCVVDSAGAGIVLDASESIGSTRRGGGIVRSVRVVVGRVVL